ncbi:hypothetical protein PM082_005601 [Marasmius tenuissimus]|nr:hypothetical protein PM082_005601 [Marasmius tenuissimus]
MASSQSTSLSESRDRVQQAIPPWLYQACGRALHLQFKNTLDRELKTTIALESLIDTPSGRHFVDQYPPRPSKAQFDGLKAGTNEETYETVNKLLEIVEGYPDTEDVETDRRLALQDNMFTGEVWVELTDVFKKEVMKSLEEVEEVAGIGAREVANWMIRDKHAERISGIHYAGGGIHLREWFDWKDESVMWLEW